MTKLSTMLWILAVLVLVACLISVSVVARVNHFEAKDLSAKLETMRAELAQTRADLAEAKDAIKEYSAVASWYGPGFHGKRAADGSIYDQGAYTIAHKTLPFGTIVVLEYKGKRVPAIVTDRGPYIDGRDFDLSLGLAKRLGLMTKGVDQIKVFQVDVD
jgi:rare lipoprotein A